MKVAKLSATIYQTTQPNLPIAVAVDDRERRKLLELAQTFDVFIHADLGRNEGLLGHRCPKTKQFRAWATARMRDLIPGTKELSPTTARTVVALALSRQPLSALECRARGNPDVAPISEAAARASLNKGLAAIDYELEPGLRLSTVRTDAVGDVPARYRIAFGWGAAQDRGRPHTVLSVCIVIVDEVEVADSLPQSAAPPVAPTHQIGPGATARKPPRPAETEPVKRQRSQLEPKNAAKPTPSQPERSKSTKPQRSQRAAGPAGRAETVTSSLAMREPSDPDRHEHYDLIHEGVGKGLVYKESTTVRIGFHNPKK